MSLLRRIGIVARQHGSASIGARQQTGSRAVVPPPIRGLNRRDAYATMEKEYAVNLDNYFPDHGGVRLRPGSKEYATGVGSGYVETLIPHDGTAKQLFAIGGGKVHDISEAGAVKTALATGLTKSRWNYATMNRHTLLVNGTDDLLRIEPAGTLANDAPATITGPDGAALTTAQKRELQTVTVFKSRMFFTRKDSPVIYYLPLRAIAGDLTAFDLSWVEPEGGNALHIASMTVDAGDGPDDLFLVFMEHGLVLLYKGIDPSSTGADGFFKVGAFRIGALVGDGAPINVGGDVYAHTTDGVVSMQQIFQRGRSGQDRIGVSDMIVPALREQAAIYGPLSGWGAILHPPLSWLMFSAPAPGGEQYVMNTRTGAWCRFKGYDARCWARFKDKLYFGGSDGHVYEAGVGTQDNRSGAARNIEGDIQTAFNYFGSNQEKRFTMIRALVEANNTVSIQLGATADFADSGVLLAPISIEGEGAVWDDAIWDDAEWGTGKVFHKAWQATNRQGTALSVRLATRSQGASIALYATDVVYENASGIA